MADESNTVVTAVGDRFWSELVSLDDRHVVVQSKDGQTRLEVDDLVRWSHPVAPPPRSQVLLADGTLLVTADDWMGLGPLQLGAETITVLTASFDRVELPRQLVAAVVVTPPHDPAQHQQLIDTLGGHDERTDKLWLVGGDLLTGTVQSTNDDQWTVSTETGEVILPSTSIQAVAFNPQLLARQPAAESVVAVGFHDGSLVHAKSLQSSEDHVRLTATTDLQLADAPLADVVALQTIRSSRFTYLSDLEPADYRQVPYLQLEWPWRRDRSLLGGWLRSGGDVYLKGVAMHSAARLTFALDGTHRTFAAEIALDDAAGTRGSVVFRVFVAREGEWHEAFASNVVRGGDSPRPITVDVADAQAITLIVDYADRGDELDHANWLDARLVK